MLMTDTELKEEKLARERRINARALKQANKVAKEMGF